MYYVYFLRNLKNGTFYIGYTSNLRRRKQEHGKEWELLYYEAYRDKTLAIKRERQIKQYGGSLRALKKRLGL